MPRLTLLWPLVPLVGGLSLPFSTQGRDIIDANGNAVLYAGTNWPAHQEAMIPEGLQYASISSIVRQIVDLGLNSVRLTYAIEMVDDILDGGADVSLQETLTQALGETNGTNVLTEILANNEGFTNATTRFEVFDAVAQELAAQDIILHLDNHVSRAKWCCGEGDGNGWFGEEYFDVEKWIRGWKYMAEHGAKSWPSFASVGLRNELRSATDAEPYDWYTWYTHMTTAASTIHDAAPDLVIFFGGLGYDTDIKKVPLGQTLQGTNGTSTAGKTAQFVPSDFDFAPKIVLELHKYDFEETQANCSAFGDGFYETGFQAVNPEDPATEYVFPVVISEWGFKQDGVYFNSTTYNECMIEFVDEWKVGWMQWDVAGSYYVQTRDGATNQDVDEAWGLLNHTWDGIRSPVTVENSLDKMIDALN